MSFQPLSSRVSPFLNPISTDPSCPSFSAAGGSDSCIVQGPREDLFNRFLVIPDAAQPADLLPQLLYLATQTLPCAHILQVRSSSSLTPGSARGPRCPCGLRSAELHPSLGASTGLRSPLSRNSCSSGYWGLCFVVCLLLLSMCTLSSVEFLAPICTKCCPFDIHFRSSTYAGTSLVPVEMVHDPP